MVAIRPLATVNLGVFIFVMTGVIFVTQHRSNSDILNYADALCFTVTTLMTTGFGDILLTGTGGRLLAVVVMIVGVTLFLRLAQVLFRPRRTAAARFRIQASKLIAIGIGSLRQIARTNGSDGGKHCHRRERVPPTTTSRREVELACAAVARSVFRSLS